MQGRDVLGCAETGSGKTAAFALPILHHLSQDPYGVFAVVLTPTRELAIQISEQFSVLGAPIGVQIALVIGGVNMTEQGKALAKLPHVVIATPGRLRHHLEGPDPPHLARTPYLVLDEADRLLSAGFSSELQTILSHMSHPRRRTLLFSATLTSSLTELEMLAMKETLRFDLTSEQRIPTQLMQQYLFMPAQVKMCYLVAVLRKVLESQQAQRDDDDDGDDKDGIYSSALQKKNKGDEKKGKKGKKSADGKLFDAAALAPAPSSSIIIFVGTCRRCQEVAEVLLELGIDCVALHSMMTQLRRNAALGKFKSHISRILIATDVASRGLDIPAVDLVINMDLPKVAVDYVHRVGRTARAGRRGRSLSLITQYDLELVHAIEAYTEQKLELSEEVKEAEIIPFLNPVAKAVRVAQLKLLEVGFDEQAEKFDKRKKAEKKKKRLRIKAQSEEENSKGKEEC